MCSLSSFLHENWLRAHLLNRYFPRQSHLWSWFIVTFQNIESIYRSLLLCLYWVSGSLFFNTHSESGSAQEFFCLKGIVPLHCSCMHAWYEGLPWSQLHNENKYLPTHADQRGTDPANSFTLAVSLFFKDRKLSTNLSVLMQLFLKFALKWSVINLYYINKLNWIYLIKLNWNKKLALQPAASVFIDYCLQEASL